MPGPARASRALALVASAAWAGESSAREAAARHAPGAARRGAAVEPADLPEDPSSFTTVIESTRIAAK
jgi:hypothetical protein